MEDERDAENGEHPLANLLAFGGEAAAGTDLATLLNRACEELVAGLGVSHAKVLEYREDEDAFVVVAGVGWAEDVVGQARLSPALESPAGFALKTGAPTIAADLEREVRFSVPPILRAHGVRSAVNVIVRTGDLIYGVLEADSREPRQFDRRDTQFLQGYANILALAVEQHRLAAHNAALREERDRALAELHHRSSNNQQLLTSMLDIQRRRHPSLLARQLLDDIAARVRTLAELDAVLHDTGAADRVDLARYLQGIVAKRTSTLADAPTALAVVIEVVPVEVSTADARALGLIVNEFVSESLKSQTARNAGGRLGLKLAREGERARLRLENDGPRFERHGDGDFAVLLIETLARSLGADLAWTEDAEKGLELGFAAAEGAAAK